MDSLNISSNSPIKKLVFQKVGSFLIIKKIGSSAYELWIPKSLYPVIIKSKLSPYHRLIFTQQHETSLTVITPNQESATQEVERILNSRRWGDRLQYLIKWQEQPFEESIWENRGKDASQLCQDFHNSHLDVPMIWFQSYSEGSTTPGHGGQFNVATAWHVP